MIHEWRPFKKAQVGCECLHSDFQTWSVTLCNYCLTYAASFISCCLSNYFWADIVPVLSSRYLENTKIGLSSAVDFETTWRSKNITNPWFVRKTKECSEYWFHYVLASGQNIFFCIMRWCFVHAEGWGGVRVLPHIIYVLMSTAYIVWEFLNFDAPVCCVDLFLAAGLRRTPRFVFCSWKNISFAAMPAPIVACFIVLRSQW